MERVFASPELMILIFSHASPHVQHKSRIDDLTDALQDIFVFARVCRAWRAVIQGNPELTPSRSLRLVRKTLTDDRLLGLLIV